MKMKLSTMASARRLAFHCLEVSEQKKNDILDHLDSEWRARVIEAMTQIKKKREDK